MYIKRNRDGDNIRVVLSSIPPNQPNQPNHSTPHCTTRHQFNNNHHQLIMIKIMDPIKKINNQHRDDIDKIDTQEEKREN